MKLELRDTNYLRLIGGCLSRDGVCLGTCLPGGVCGGMSACGVSAWGMCLPRAVSVCLPGDVHPLWTEFLTHDCENITFLNFVCEQ